MAQRNKRNKNKKSGLADSVLGTAEWVLMAFSVTLVFIVFVMQAYTIPTGSMASSLKGAHFKLRCSQCGYLYDYGFDHQRYNLSPNVTPGGDNVVIEPLRTGRGNRVQRTLPPRCPSCGYFMAPVKLSYGRPVVPPERVGPVTKGDRIFVLKCIYQFIEPSRWDVVVFKNPVEPAINYIKRMIALPGETVEIVDGDIYIDGKMARKPENVQEEMWMSVYDNDYHPVEPEIARYNGHTWVQPFVNTEGSQWDLTENSGRLFKLESSPDNIHTIYYDTSKGNDFRASYAYNNPRSYKFMPVCSDLMAQFQVQAGQGDAVLGAELTKYGIRYRGRVNSDGTMVISRIDAEDTITELAAGQGKWVQGDEAKRFRFMNVDHRLVLEFGDSQIEYDLGRDRDDAGTIIKVMPEAKIFGAGELTLSHVGLFRDMHYTQVTQNGDHILRAGAGDPFTLSDDQYFVCGDNSPASFDSRLWDQPGLGNSGREYREGVVPREYLVGKAFFVYWPGGYQPKIGNKGFGPRLVPNTRGMKAIYGGRYQTDTATD
ncbi:Signal peptidase I T [Anaerohalosphaera lusitana]|uniref:Signal peptidase I n=1 Tax=Anaerohalosphaera lusitana TaxID=1936003 RepID=A0A1U9NNK6_9BACT|nr:signal peptidase I [Anaerohalosphaera lusitana]AQT69415.1 Signal peptidase I T [Anaerohalosphaera lusitana]